MPYQTCHTRHDRIQYKPLPHLCPSGPYRRGAFSGHRWFPGEGRPLPTHNYWGMNPRDRDSNSTSGSSADFSWHTR